MSKDVAAAAAGAAVGAVTSAVLDYIQGRTDERALDSHPLLSQVPSTERLRLANLRLALRVAKNAEASK
ncbi:MAG: hypothetical protein LC119_05585 [Burkholderiales bacterium]|nr:hypothetical protein [Burkholderiales bacterium]